MSDMTYISRVNGEKEKTLMILSGEIKTPPLSKESRIEVGFLLRKLQQGDSLSMPQSRPMPVIGRRCHELRINDRNSTWRIIYRIDDDAVIILEIFSKKTQKTSKGIIEICRRRIRSYDK